MKGDDTVINESEVAGRIGGYFGVVGSDPRIASLLAKVMPEIKLASASNPSSWQSTFLNVMSKYEGLAKEMGLGVSQDKRDFDILKHANRTDAAFAGAATRLGLEGLRHYAMLHGSGGGGEERDGGSRG